MVDGYGPVFGSNVVGFFVGVYVYYLHTPQTLFVIHVVGYLTLLVGLATIAKIRGIHGTPGGFLFGLGLGITFAGYFLSDILSVI